MNEPTTAAEEPTPFCRDMNAMLAAILAETSKSERGRKEAMLAEYLAARDRGESPVAFTSAEGE